MKALRIGKEYGTWIISSLRKYGWLDSTRNVIRDDTIIEVPVVTDATRTKLDRTLPEELTYKFELITQYKSSIKKTGKRPIDQIIEKCKKTLDLTPSEFELLPTKWELLGDILILRLPLKLKSYWNKIASIYAEQLHARSVLRRFDKIQGVYRQPGVEFLYGDEHTETTHIENKVKFRIDPMQIMFSSGNIDERIRIATLAQPQDTIVDMFGGIGYFSIPLAVHSKPKKIIACELNPVAFEYLNTNIQLNHVGHIIQAILGDNRKMIPEGIADRIVMGYIKSDDTHRAAAIKILKPMGGVLHFHDVGFKNNVKKTALDKFSNSLENSGFNKNFEMKLLNYYKIKSYGPKLDHVVLDILVELN